MITIRGAGLTIGDIAAVAHGAPVSLSGDPAIVSRVHASRERIAKAIRDGQQIYGVTTLYGGMADHTVSGDKLQELQRVSLRHHKVAAGPRLPEPDVRAAMLLRANSLMKGASGIRLEIIERYVAFLNARATPHVFQRGSIGASGDLSPLAYIGGAIVGLDPEYKVDLDGQEMDSHSALARIGLQPIALEPKEGLALSNGTTASTGVAANCVERAFALASLALGVHALYFQALLATSQSFDPFIHAMKPHPGQIWAGETMRMLLTDSKLIRDEAAGARAHRKGTLIQDRYSLRCLPQFVGPIVDGITLTARQIETEANSANDNPLIDPDTGEIFHTGNFLAQYTGVAMDSLRYQLGMLAKHLDVQIALLVTPEFSYGLNPSLVGNMELGLNVGLKSLQLSCNALMPLVSYFGQSMTDRFPTHAEQFNQNINSQAMNAANLARDQLDIFEHYLANALIFGIQAVELRSHAVTGSYDARAVLSPATQTLYLAAREAAGAGTPASDRPLVWNDTETFIDKKVRALMTDIAARGRLFDAMTSVREGLRRRSHQ